jgi:hypothetical protein
LCGNPWNRIYGGCILSVTGEIAINTGEINRALIQRRKPEGIEQMAFMAMRQNGQS